MTCEILLHCSMIIGGAINANLLGYITLEYLFECKCIEVPKLMLVFFTIIPKCLKIAEIVCELNEINYGPSNFLKN